MLRACFLSALTAAVLAVTTSSVLAGQGLLRRSTTLEIAADHHFAVTARLEIVMPSADDCSLTLSGGDAATPLRLVEAVSSKEGGLRFAAWPSDIARRGDSIQVTFHHLARGDSCALAVRYAPQSGLDKDWQSHASIPFDTLETEFEYVLRAPAGLAIQYASGGVSLSEKSLPGGRIERRWTGRLPAGAKPEPNAAEPSRAAPYVEVSLPHSWNEIGLSFWNDARAATAVTPRIKALAERVVAGLAGRRQRAEALARWVAVNVRYDNGYPGYSLVEPRPADVVADTRFGDCKDQAVLLFALMQAQGIEAALTLVKVDEWTSRPVPSISAFDHMIVYLPEFDLYADTTGRSDPFVAARKTHAGKWVLRIGAAGGTLVRIPAAAPEDNRSISATEIDLGADRRVSVTTRTQANGFFAELYRYMAQVARTRGDKPKQFLSVLQDSYHVPGRWRAVEETVRDDEAFALAIHVDGASAPPAPLGAFVTMRSLALPRLGVWALFATDPGHDRRTDFRCRPTQLEDTTTVILPTGIAAGPLPNDVAIARASLSYQSTWVRRGNRIVIHRSLTLRSTGSCPAAMTADIPAFAAAVDADLRHPLTLFEAGKDPGRQREARS